MSRLVTYGSELRPNYASERLVMLYARARVRRCQHFTPFARLKTRRAAAQSERWTDN